MTHEPGSYWHCSPPLEVDICPAMNDVHHMRHCALALKHAENCLIKISLQRAEDVVWPFGGGCWFIVLCFLPLRRLSGLCTGLLILILGGWTALERQVDKVKSCPILLPRHAPRTTTAKVGQQRVK